VAKLRAAIIGCGRKGDDKRRTGCGVSQHHARAYNALPNVELAALCDLVPQKAEAFRQEHGGGDERVYADYREMLREEAIDIVSVCTWPAVHAPIVIGCAEAGVRAVHCEKPMALTWDGAKRMAAACEAAGVQLTLNHQRRFGPSFRKVKELAADGAVGDVLRIETYTGNLYDWGTHWFDMMFFFNDDSPAEWAMGQIDLRDSGSVFGAPLEGQGLSLIHFRNGVFGLMCTGKKAPREVEIRLLGTKGVIELGRPGEVGLRVMGKGHRGWKVLDKKPPLHGPEYFVTAMADVLDALENGREPELSARRALQTTEVIFATYESSRRGGRIDLPLDVEDSPLAALLAARGR
jgi:predicted dehydrogenase